MSYFDPSKSKPAPLRSTLTLLNNFILTSATFLNEFSDTVEKKISGITIKINQLEILLAVVEAKLNSIPDLGEGQSSAPKAPTSSSVPPPPPSGPPASSTANDEGEPEAASIAQETSTPEGKVQASAHPDYIPFLKMLKVGVPPPIVANKLSSLGLDPAAVDNPSMLIDL